MKTYLFILLLIGLCFSSTAYANAVPCKQKLIMPYLKDSIVLKKTHKKKRVKKSLFKRKKIKKQQTIYQTRHYPENPHIPWGWILLAWTVLALILLIIGLLLSIYWLWFIAFLAILLVPSSLIVALIIIIIIS